MCRGQGPAYFFSDRSGFGRTEFALLLDQFGECRAADQLAPHPHPAGVLGKAIHRHHIRMPEFGQQTSLGL